MHWNKRWKAKATKESCVGTRKSNGLASKLFRPKPIEHLWAKVKRHVYGDGKQLFSKDNRVKQSMAFIPKSTIANLTGSVNDRHFNAIGIIIIQK